MALKLTAVNEGVVDIRLSDGSSGHYFPRNTLSVQKATAALPQNAAIAQTATFATSATGYDAENGLPGDSEPNKLRVPDLDLGAQGWVATATQDGQSYSRTYFQMGGYINWRRLQLPIAGESLQIGLYRNPSGADGSGDYFQIRNGPDGTLSEAVSVSIAEWVTSPGVGQTAAQVTAIVNNILSTQPAGESESPNMLTWHNDTDAHTITFTGRNRQKQTITETISYGGTGESGLTLMAAIRGVFSELATQLSEWISYNPSTHELTIEIPDDTVSLDKMTQAVRDTLTSLRTDIDRLEDFETALRSQNNIVSGVSITPTVGHVAYAVPGSPDVPAEKGDRKLTFQVNATAIPDATHTIKLTELLALSTIEVGGTFAVDVNAIQFTNAPGDNNVYFIGRNAAGEFVFGTDTATATGDNYLLSIIDDKIDATEFVDFPPSMDAEPSELLSVDT